MILLKLRFAHVLFVFCMWVFQQSFKRDFVPPIYHFLKCRCGWSKIGSKCISHSLIFTDKNPKMIRDYPSCLRRILKIHWLEIISNKELGQRRRDKKEKIGLDRSLNLRKPKSNITCQALTLNPQGKRK